MLTPSNATGASVPSLTPGFTIEIGHAHGNSVRYRAIVRNSDSCIVGYGGACKTTYAAHESGEKLAAKEGAK